tara:strand:- start:197 stop:403 length:207 start_codon:yes stop_codon:yes gene_type:complete
MSKFFETGAILSVIATMGSILGTLVFLVAFMFSGDPQDFKDAGTGFVVSIVFLVILIGCVYGGSRTKN